MLSKFGCAELACSSVQGFRVSGFQGFRAFGRFRVSGYIGQMTFSWDSVYTSEDSSLYYIPEYSFMDSVYTSRAIARDLLLTFTDT
jgi:hypothetical protein